MTLRHSVALEQGGLLLHTVLKRDLRFSTAMLQTLKAVGGVAVGGESRYMNQRVYPGECIEVSFPQEPPTDAPVESGEIHVLYEDEALLALDKPPGMLVHPSLSSHYGTLLGLALGHLAAKGETPVLHPVHRLDRDTSGIVLFARHGFVQAHLMSQMKRGEMGKQYAAIACGKPVQNSGEIRLAIDRDPDNYLLRQVALHGKPAVTRYQVLAGFQRKGFALSRLALWPQTGRTHQLRVHCAALGMPLLGDLQYATEESAAISRALGVQGQCLHDEALSFIHPLCGKTVEISCQPERFGAILGCGDT